ncbi:MAG TPA: poly(R)-hydroxyalkanoic acid synthase subunit PhaE [Steroidobacteraceae bacterium]|nr:poly(R)-hydroxyalkanoic acid synthase subunit PhaE [Steroidobacteraceae bacterium]
MTAPGAAPGGASLQQFLAACEQHVALMQTLAGEMGKGAQESAGQPLFDRLSAWQRSVESGHADPFGILRELGAFGAQAPQAPLASLQRMASLQSRVLESHARLLAHGADIAREAMQHFAARAVKAPPDPSSLYTTWIDCAEEAYANHANREDYCQSQAELVNALNSLRLEQRSQIEEWARALDLPTRTEMNALIRRVKALEAAQASPPKAKPAKSRPLRAKRRR